MSKQRVYVIAPENSGRPCKIGISNDPRKRLNSIQTGFPERLVIWSSWELEHLSPPEVEKSAHKHFDDRRLIGEWFDIPAQEAEDFLGAVESEFDGFRWVTTHAMDFPLRVFD